MKCNINNKFINYRFCSSLFNWREHVIFKRAAQQVKNLDRNNIASQFLGNMINTTNTHAEADLSDFELNEGLDKDPACFFGSSKRPEIFSSSSSILYLVGPVITVLSCIAFVALLVVWCIDPSVCFSYSFKFFYFISFNFFKIFSTHFTLNYYDI